MTRVKVAAVLFVLWVLQVAIMSHVRPFGVSPDLLLVAALVGGIVGGSDFGVRHGFVAGVLLDLVVPGPLGLAAGIYGLLGYATGSFSRAVDSDDPRVLPILIGVTGFLGVVAYGLALGILGSEHLVQWRLIGVAVVVGLVSVPLALPVRWAYGWARADAASGARPDVPSGVVN